MASLSAELSRRVGTAPAGYLYVFIAILGGSTASVIVKGVLASTHIAPIPLLSMRLLIAAALLWALMVVVFHQRLTLDRRFIMGVLVAGVSNAISLSCFYLALTYMDASVAMVLFSTNPLVVLAMLRVLGEPLRRIDGIRAALAIFGVVLLVGIGGQVAWQGVVLVTITAVLFSVHMVSIQRMLKGYPTSQVTPMVITVMALCVSAVHFLTTPIEGWFDFPPQGWFVIGFTAVFSTVIARLALIEGIQRIGSGQAALLSPIETLLAVFWASLFLGERMTPIQVFGGMLILISAALVARGRVKR